jgi:hypothetical protein
MVNAEGGAKEAGFLTLEMLKEIVVFEAITELGSVIVIVVDDNPHSKLVEDGVIRVQVAFG